ncbi:hypothetical protein ECC02_008893 [Trypanosoma cruzi]|uniref:Uncharacterized protein n=1 Tax=Trypanosoma cruzi TaxID=5693 RepID=A0A7J6XUP2_TRYCR|nr:hypothetical protein ECC02_008893 [Trypanosoma cruzi]
MKGGRLRRFAIHVLFGQLVAFLNSVTGVSTTKLVNNNASYPLLQSLTAYAFIFTVYAPIFLLLYIRNRHRRFFNFVFLQKPWKYAVLGLIDMEANFFIVKAFQYTDMISVQLLNCFNIPCVFVLSFFILKMRFAVTHIVGCLVATTGLVVLIVLDADGVTRNKVGPNVAKGDLFCLLAAALYATSNVLMEWFIKPQPRGVQLESAVSADTNPEEEGVNSEVDRDMSSFRERQIAEEQNEFSSLPNTIHVVESGRERDQEQSSGQVPESLPEVANYIPLVENLCCMSGCALLFTVIQFFVLEWSSFASGRKTWTDEDWLFQMMFGLSMLFVYTGLPLLFLVASAVFANVSLLSVSVYSIIWNVTIFNIYPTPVFFASYVIIILGIFVYDISDFRWSWCPHINYPCDDSRDSSSAPAQSPNSHPDAVEGGTAYEEEIMPDAGITNNSNQKAGGL